ncbi:AAA family ATPase [Rhizobium laguerreae]|uniref:ATP-binding protein n=1 Tax=Rhizobium laguerreae TaxID=1076926 RepID=UPI001C8FD8B6|nr:ATP-binding protein [Rhizobium laguerreae]MBY3233449.1 AAA family ATPase [Rhizobium laguerreae]
MTTQSSITSLSDASDDVLAVTPNTGGMAAVIESTFPKFNEAAQALLATMSHERQQRAERRGKTHAKYVKMPKDDLINEAIDMLTENAAAAFFGESGKRRALWLLGESDSGKTRSMEYHIPKRPEFRPYVTPAGEEFKPFVSFEAPRPITLKGFARKALAACGYPMVPGRLTEQELFELLKEVIRTNRILFMHVDEMQHVLKGTTTKEIQNVSDIIKSLLQIPDWPLHMILSGVPSLARFLSPEDGDSQLRNRSFIVELKQMTNKDAKALLGVQKQIVLGEGLSLGETDSEEFMHRLIHGCVGACGTIIQTIQAAAERAIVYPEKANPNVVTLNHYASVYALYSGCRPSENVFLQDDWKSIDPRLSLAKMLAKATRDEMPIKTKKKGA